eukprot:5616223-Amphidinium_carterae.1
MMHPVIGSTCHDLYEAYRGIHGFNCGNMNSRMCKPIYSKSRGWYIPHIGFFWNSETKLRADRTLKCRVEDELYAFPTPRFVGPFCDNCSWAQRLGNSASALPASMATYMWCQCTSRIRTPRPSAKNKIPKK